MPTEAFLASYKEADARRHRITYKEKTEIWKLCHRDWRNGRKPSAYIPFDAAEEIHQSKARVITISAGNRFAKTTIAAMEGVADMCFPGSHIFILAPELSICENEWVHFVECLTQTDLYYKRIRLQVIEQMNRLGLKGSPDKFVHVRGGNKKMIRIDWPDPEWAPCIAEMKSYGRKNSWLGMEGVALSLIIFAEGSRVPIDLVERHLIMRLADKSGRIINPATPKGRDQYLYPSFLKGQSEEMKVHIDYSRKEVSHTYVKVDKNPHHIDVTSDYMESYETFQYPGFANPFYNIAEYNRGKELLFKGELDENAFLERYFGCFVSMSGSFYNGTDWGKCLVDAIDFDFETLKDATHYVSIDPGRSTRASAHWIAIFPPDDFGVSQWVIYDELYQKGLWAEKIAELILERNKYPIQGYFIDRAASHSTSLRERTEEMVIRDCGCSPMSTPQNMPKTSIERLKHWKPWVRRGQIRIIEDRNENLVREMRGLEYKEPEYKNGISALVEDVVGECHALDDITYAVYCRPRFVVPECIPEIEHRYKPAASNSFRKAMEKSMAKDSSLSMLGTF